MPSTPHNAYPKRHAGHDKYSSTRRKTSRLPRVTFAHVQLHRCVLAARARLSRSRLGERVFFSLHARAPRAIATRRTNERDGCETMRSSAAGDLRANDYIIIPSLVRRARRRVVVRGVKTRDDDAVIFRARARVDRRTNRSPRSVAPIARGLGRFVLSIRGKSGVFVYSTRKRAPSFERVTDDDARRAALNRRKCLRARSIFPS